MNRSDRLPYRIELCGAFVDSSLFTKSYRGNVIAVSIKPTYNFIPGCGMATSTRYYASTIWNGNLPKNIEELARDIFYVETGMNNHPSSTADVYGILIPGCSKLEYYKSDWPIKIDFINDQETLQFIHDHIFLYETHPRYGFYNPFADVNMDPTYIQPFYDAADIFWDALKRKDFIDIGKSMNQCREAMDHIFPHYFPDDIKEIINQIAPNVAGIKSTGAGNGGYLVVAAEKQPPGSIPVSPVGWDESYENDKCTLPYRLELCGSFMDCDRVNRWEGGDSIVVSLKPTHKFTPGCGMSTSTRHYAFDLYGNTFPNKDKVQIAKDIIQVESGVGLSTKFGSIDALGMVLSGISRLHYPGNSEWPTEIETLTDQESLRFIRDHVYLTPLQPRQNGYDIFANANIQPEYVANLATASRVCWDAIKHKDVRLLGLSMNLAYYALVKMLPAVETKEVHDAMEKYRPLVSGAKLTGGGGGGYIVLASELPIFNAIQITPVGLD